MTRDRKKKRIFRQSLAVILQKMLHRPLLPLPYDGRLRSIVILAQEKFGDAILLTPLLKLMKQHFPETEVHVVAFSHGTHDFFRTDRNIDLLHLARGDLRHYLPFIFTGRFDFLFNTKDHPSTSFIVHSLLIRAKKRAAVGCKYHRGIYDYLVDAGFHSPVALKNCGLMEVLGKPVTPEECRPYLPEKPVSSKVRAFLETLPERSVAGFNISAGSPNRFWTGENWSRLADAFPDEVFLVLSAPGDCEEKRKLERRCHNIITSPDTANIYEAGLITGRLKLLVTPDTAMVHAASCFNTPVLGLYGCAPQDRSRFRPFLTEYRMVVSRTAYVSDIDTESVIDACGKMLNH